MLKPGRYCLWKTVSSYFYMLVRPRLLHRPSFLFDCFVKIWATCKNFLGKWLTANLHPLPPPPPTWQKIARTPMLATPLASYWPWNYRRCTSWGCWSILRCRSQYAWISTLLRDVWHLHGVRERLVLKSVVFEGYISWMVFLLPQ